jgi:DNA-binding XRE family transcriptional regulator
MKIHPQIILQGKIPAFAILPYKEYEALLQTLEDIEDIEIISSAESDCSEKFPLELVEKIASGTNPIRAYREYRKLSQVALAKKANISKQYISQLETGERKGSPKILKTIAKILTVDLDDLI